MKSYARKLRASGSKSKSLKQSEFRVIQASLVRLVDLSQSQRFQAVHKRASESPQKRPKRLKLMSEATKVRRTSETAAQYSDRLRKHRARQRNNDASSPNTHQYSLSDSRKEQIWRLFNQNQEPSNDDDMALDLETLAESYDRDVREFCSQTSSALLQYSCAVCGTVNEHDSKMYGTKDEILFRILFGPLRKLTDRDWPKYCSSIDKVVLVCSICARTLRRKANNIPRFSRANIPLPDASPVLQKLSFIEQMLISPVLPMVCVWRYKTFGQYQSKGQCVAFWNQLQKLANGLPRTLSEVIVNVKNTYGHADIIIRVHLLRKDLIFLKENHPSFKDIQISEENFVSIQHDILNLRRPSCVSDSYNDEIVVGNSLNLDSQSENPLSLPLVSSLDPSSGVQSVRDAGQNQMVEEHVAQTALTVPVTIEATESRAQISRTVTQLFNSLARKEAQMFRGNSGSDGWQ